MTWSSAIPLKKEELEALKRQRSFYELRSRVADLPRPRPVSARLQPVSTSLEPSPVPGGQLIVPVSAPASPFGDVSPFSIEALVAAELATRSTPELTRPPVIPLVPELKRLERPLPEPRALSQRVPGALELYRPTLSLHPSILAVWTDRFYYQAEPEDLPAVRGWFDERRDEVPTPGLIRADLVIDPYQVFETIVLGGDAALVVAAAVTRNQLEDLLGWGGEIGVDLLVYLSGTDDAHRALSAGARHFVIGDGDLFDSSQGKRGAGWLRELGRELPRDAVKVSWGGVRSIEDVDARAAAGATAVVAGSAYRALHESLRRRASDGEG